VHRGREIAHLAGGAERRPTRQIAGGEGARDVAQLAQRPRDGPPEQQRAPCRESQRGDAGQQHAALHVGDERRALAHRGSRDAHHTRRAARGARELARPAALDVPRRAGAPTGPRRASATSGSVAYRASHPCARSRVSESPTTRPAESSSVTCRPSSSASESASRAGIASAGCQARAASDASAPTRRAVSARSPAPVRSRTATSTKPTRQPTTTSE
jgi:hypothetical protein